MVSNAVSGKQAPRSRKRFPGLQPSPIFLVVHRFDFSVYYKRVQPEAFQLLQAIEERKPLGEALEMAFAESPATPSEQANLIQNWFLNWSELGWFCKADLDKHSTDAHPHGEI